MKSTDGSARQKGRFFVLENYSGRYTAASSRPPFSASDLPSNRPVSQSAVDSNEPIDPANRLIKVRPASQSYSSKGSSDLILKPYEVLHTDFLSQDSVSDSLFLTAYRMRADGAFKSAVQHYTDLLTDDPRHIQARINLGVCYMKLGDTSKAREIYADEAARGNADFRLLYNYAILLVLGQDYRNAKQVLEEASLTASGNLARDVGKLLKSVQDAISMEKIPVETSVSKAVSPVSNSRILSKNDFSQFQESTQSFSKSKSVLKSKYHSFSLSKGRTSSSFLSFLPTKPTEPPKPTLWKVFKTVDEYSSRPNTASVSGGNRRFFRPSSHSQKNSPKPSFITASSPYKTYRPPVKFDVSEVTEDRTISGLSSTVPDVSKTIVKNPEITRTHMANGLIEEDLEDEKQLRKVQVDLVLENSVKEKAVEVSNVMHREAEKLNKLKNLLPTVDLKPILFAKLGAEALSDVRFEMKKDPDMRDYELLLKAVSQLKFFAKFQSDIRKKFLEIGEIRMFAQGQVVFNQEDFGDFMYVIIHGSITVKRLNVEYGSEPLIVNTLFDGESFGELGLFSPEQQGKPEGRSASCIAAENTDLLLITKASYHSIMVHEIENELEKMIDFLKALPFLYGAEQMNLIPLASNLDPMTFGFNQTVVEKGDVLSGLYIILSGYCNVYSEGFCLRPRILANYASVRIRSVQPKPFRIGNTTFHSPRPQTQPEIEEIPGKAITAERIAASPALRDRIQSFFNVKDLTELLKDHYITQERILKKALQPTDFFAGRALLEGRLDTTTGLLRKNGPCKYSIVAESSQVQILVITRSQLPLLGEKLMDQIKKYLEKTEDCDCPQEAKETQINQEFREWSRYKAKVVDQARRSQFLARDENRNNPGPVL